VLDWTGSKSETADAWHDGAVHGLHCTHDTSLPVSIIMFWVTAGDPMPR
jgi:hypothetical protein